MVAVVRPDGSGGWTRSYGKSIEHNVDVYVAYCRLSEVYRSQGVDIHDKHIELIVRQMTRRIGVQEPGGTAFRPGERVDRRLRVQG